MTRTRAYPRAAYRALLRAWLRRHWRVLAGFGALTAAVGLVGTAAMALMPPTAFRWWLMGFVHAALLVGAAHLVVTAFVMHERKAITQLRGAWGEEATRDELRRARRRRLIWGWVDSINLEIGDIDHLVLTRDGRFLAIDSKWRTGTIDPDEVAASARRTRTRAAGLLRTTLAAERGRHRARQSSVEVVPVVVAWGPAQADIPENAMIGDVHVVPGRQLLTFLAGYRTPASGRPQARFALRAVTQRREALARATTVGS